MSDARRLSGLETLIARLLGAEGLQDTDRDEFAYSVFSEIFSSDYLEAMNSIGLAGLSHKKSTHYG